MTVEVVPLATHVGAELRGVDLGGDLDDEGVEALWRAVLAHHVVFVRDQALEPVELLALGERLGVVERGVRTPAEGFPDVAELATTEGGSPEVFHLDGAFHEQPPMASLTTLVEAPALGGDLLCAGTAALYEALSPPMQRLVDGLRVRYEAPGDSSRSAEHPLVQVHPETGRRHLFFDGLVSTRVVGLHHLESAELLAFLRTHLADPTYGCRHRWQVGDLVVWDNRAVVHRSTGDYAGRRMTRRVTLTAPHGAR